MATYLELPIGDHESITVEISNSGLVKAGTGEKIDRLGERFDDAVAQVVRMGGTAIKKALATARPPATIEVELGLKLTAKTGFVVAESSGEANFKIVLKWELGRDIEPTESE
jgi:hypothetical protein